MEMYWDNGKENGNYYVGFRGILFTYWDNAEKHGIYYLGLGFRVSQCYRYLFWGPLS